MTLTSPLAGTKITPDAPFKITFDFVGNVAESAQDCAFRAVDSNGSTAVPWFQMAEFDGNGHMRIWKQESFGSLLNIWQSKIIPNGIECSFTTFDTSSTSLVGNWEDVSTNDQTISALFGAPILDSSQIGTITKVVLAWGIGDPNNFTNSRIQEFQAGESASPTFSFKGIARGETLNSVKTYTVDLSMGNSLALLDNAENSFKSTGTCGQISKTVNGNRTIYERRCTVNAAYDAKRDDTTLSVSANVSTAQGGYFESEPTVLNIANTEYPVISLSDISYSYGRHSKPGHGTTVQLTGRGHLAIATSSDVSQPNFENLTDASLTLCVSSNCSSVKIDEYGNFGLDKEVAGTSIKWTLQGKYKDFTILRSSLYDQTSSALLDFLNNKEIGDTGTVLPMPKPFVAPPVLIRISNISIPSKVHWGSSFTIKVASSGSGSAKCEARFQDTLQNGRFGFKLSAGKTAFVTVTPWANIQRLWPLTVVCIPNNWPSQTYLKFPIAVNAGSIALTD